jgi:hypothetical protein
MRHEICVTFDSKDWQVIPVHAEDVLSSEDARRWLDNEFVRLECSPLRASGKLLTADKVLAVTAGAGPESFADAEWAQAFGRAACGALARPTVKVNVAAMTVAY